MSTVNELFTIGHSAHSLERLIELLALHRIGAVADVRSSPYSRYAPQFNREPLRQACRSAGMEYVFLGGELGARSNDPACIVDKQVSFERLARTAAFRRGIERLRSGMERFRVSLLCAEKDPIACHRMILVCRHCRPDATVIRHILDNGEVEDNRDSERRLMRLLSIPESDLFLTEQELIEKAYDVQGGKIAYTQEEEENDDSFHDRIHA